MSVSRNQRDGVTHTTNLLRHWNGCHSLVFCQGQCHVHRAAFAKPEVLCAPEFVRRKGWLGLQPKKRPLVEIAKQGKARRITALGEHYCTPIWPLKPEDMRSDSPIFSRYSRPLQIVCQIYFSPQLCRIELTHNSSGSMGFGCPSGFV